MSTIRNRLFPFHSISEHDKLSLYRKDVTGLAGELVKIVTGSANPQTTEVDGFSNTAVGVSYNGTYSNRPENKWAVTATVSGDTVADTIGITLLSTQETDENGFPLKFFPARCKEIGAVVSGETIPICTKATLIGVWGSYIDTSLGNPTPGNYAVISRSGNGLIAAVDPDGPNFRWGVGSSPGATGATAAWLYDTRHVVGKFLCSPPASTNTGLANEFAAQLGYAFLTLNLNK